MNRDPLKHEFEEEQIVNLIPSLWPDLSPADMDYCRHCGEHRDAHKVQMAGTESFHLGHLLSITTGILVSLVGEEYPMGGVYSILNFMTGDNLYTHALPRAAEACKPHLLAQFPHLGEAHVEESLRAALAATEGQSKEFTTGAILQWLGTAAGLYGEFFDVAPLAPGEWLAIDPLKELSAMVGDDKVIAVEVSGHSLPPGITEADCA